LQADDDLAGRYGLSLPARRLVEHRLDDLDATRDARAGAAGFLHHQLGKIIAQFEVLLLDQLVDLVVLAAEPDEQDAGEIRMARIAGERSAQHTHRHRAVGHAAARLVGQRHHAIDTRIRRQPARVAEMISDHPRDQRRAIDRGEHADKVAGAYPSVGARIALEARHGRRRADRRVRQPRADGMAGHRGFETHIVQMDMRPGADRRVGEADRLAQAMDDVATVERAKRDLVAEGNVGGGAQVEWRQRLTSPDVAQRHGDLVARLQLQHRAFRFVHRRLLSKPIKHSFA